MNSNEISKLQAMLEGAYPTSRISPTKVFDTWNLSSELLEFPNARRNDLVNLVLERCKEFPTLPQLLDCCRQLLRADRGPKQTCLICDDTYWIHYERTGRAHKDGSMEWHGDPLTVRNVKVVAGKEVTAAYNGVPIEYSAPRPCPACNH